MLKSMDNKFTDPKTVGPGLWWYIHSKAKDAIDDSSIKEFIDLMIYFSINFPCNTCRKHINEYINTHPMEDLRSLTNEKGERIGMFKWTWLFHNAVNTRLKKPYVEWETAIGMFYNDGIEICSKNCHEADTSVDTSDDQRLDVSESEIDSYENQYDQYEYSKQLPNNRVKPVSNKEDRKSKLAQGYFMSVGIPKTLQQHLVAI